MSTSSNGCFDYDEDIDVNEFFVHLQTTSPALFQDATTKRYTICVPRQGSFDVKSITEDVLATHILKTRLDHFDIRASIVTCSGKEIRLSNGSLETVAGFEYNKRVKVLFEVDYVNETDQVYKVLCIDRPLEGDSWSNVTSSDLLNQRLTTREQCMDFLWVHRKSKIKRRIDLMVSPVINLITSSDNLSDVSFHCRALYTKALALILKDPPLRKQCRSNYYFYEAVQIALETYLMALLHDSVFSRIYNLQKVQEVEFNQLYLFFTEKVSRKTLQLEKKHCVNLERAGMELEQIVRCHCPLEMGYCLDRVVNYLSYSPSPQQKRNDSLLTPNAFRHRLTTSHWSRQSSSESNIAIGTSDVGKLSRGETVVISADELLPLLVLLIVKCRIPCWLSVLHYLNNYRLSEKVNSRVSYAVITFEAAIMFIKNGHLREEYEKHQEFMESDEEEQDEPPETPKACPNDPFSQDESRLMNNHSSNADSCGGQSTLPIDSSMDETDSGIAADDILLPASKAVSTESHTAIGPSCSAIEKLFKLIKDGACEEMNELLESKGDELVEALCHPLCSCPKCEKIKGLYSRSDVDLDSNEKVSCSSRDSRGWTALHAAAFYGNQFAIEKLLNMDYTVASKNNLGLTALHLACYQGHQNITMLLLYYNSPVNAADHEGNTGLHIACLKGHYHVVNALLYQQGAEPLNVNAQNIQQETPLLIAAKFGYIDIVRELLENGADVSLENVYGEGPIQVTLDNEIRLLLLGGSQNALNRWNEAKFQPIPSIALSSFECSTTESPVSVGSPSERSPLGSMASFSVSSMSINKQMQFTNSIRGFAQTFMEDNDNLPDVNGMNRSMSYTCLSSEHDNPGWFYRYENKDKYHRNLRKLLQSVRANNIEKVLFALGAASRTDKSHPVVYTHSLCHPKCECNACSQLRKDAMNPTHEYTLTVNSQSDACDGGLAALHAAVISGFPEMCVTLLNQGASIDLSAPPSLNTALHFACQYNRAEIASLLFEYGADGNAVNREGNTPLHLAAHCGHEWPVNLLSSVYNIDLNARNNNLDTPLHLACQSGHLEAVRTLLDAKSDPSLKNQLTFTPLEVAFLNGHDKVYKFIQNRTHQLPRTLQELQSIQAEAKKLLDNSSTNESSEPPPSSVRVKSSPRRESMSVVMEEDSGTKTKKSTSSSNRVSDERSDISKTICEENKI